MTVIVYYKGCLYSDTKNVESPESGGRGFSTDCVFSFSTKQYVPDERDFAIAVAGYNPSYEGLDSVFSYYHEYLDLVYWYRKTHPNFAMSDIISAVNPLLMKNNSAITKDIKDATDSVTGITHDLMFTVNESRIRKLIPIDVHSDIFTTGNNDDAGRVLMTVLHFTNDKDLAFQEVAKYDNVSGPYGDCTASVDLVPYACPDEIYGPLRYFKMPQVDKEDEDREDDSDDDAVSNSYRTRFSIINTTLD